jgi:hypothetical protein
MINSLNETSKTDFSNRKTSTIFLIVNQIENVLVGLERKKN